MAEHLELPRPGRLLRTVAWNLTESVGLPGVGYVIGQELAGRNAAMISAAAVLWLTALVRKVVTGSVPGLVTITALVLTVQALVVVSTGNVFFFLLQFPLANLAMALLFARTAPTRKPLIAQLAAEVVALRQPSTHHPALHRFFQGATWFWAGLFLLLTLGMAVMMVTEPYKLFMLLSTAVTVALTLVGAAVCLVWFRAVLRRLGLRLRFSAA